MRKSEFCGHTDAGIVYAEQGYTDAGIVYTEQGNVGAQHFEPTVNI